MAAKTPIAQKANAPKPKTKILDKELVEKVVADAEAFLQAQLTSGIAADQRALVYSGFLSAAVAALVAGAASLLSAKDPDWQLIALALLEGCGLLLALALAIHSARPVHFWYPGNEPSNWESDIATCRNYVECMLELSENLEKRIIKNRAALKKNAALMRLALWLGFSAIGMGLSLFIAILCQRLVS